MGADPQFLTCEQKNIPLASIGNKYCAARVCTCKTPVLESVSAGTAAVFAHKISGLAHSKGDINPYETNSLGSEDSFINLEVYESRAGERRGGE
jgi:hypothetical protein